MTRWNLGPLLAPRSIAIVGASESPDSWAPEIERSLRHVGFDGELYPVNPKYSEVWGRRCRSSVRELPRGVDLAVIVVPARVAVRMVDDCGTAGVRSVMVVSSGFAEAGDEGRALQAELRETALRHRLPVFGPNVEGFVNYVERVAPYGTTPPPEPVAGSISVISQSGTVAWAMNQLASDRGAGLRIILGVGNEAVLGLGDLFAWAAADPHTKVVCTYIETMRDVPGIGRGLDALRAARKPILVCAPEGRSEAARRSIVAHTGALAGNTALRDAWLRGCGAILVEDPVTMFEAAVLLSFGTRMRTNGVAAALQSGGACTLFAEAAGAQGLELPEFSAATKRKLRKALPHFASQNNPLDVTGQAAVETGMFCEALEGLARDPAVGFVAFDAFPPREEGEDVWAEPVLRRAPAAQGDRRRVRVGRHGCVGLRRRRQAVRRRRATAVPAGAPGGDGRDPRVGRAPGARARALPDLPSHPNRRRRSACSAAWPVRSTRRRARGCSSSTACGVPRSAPSCPRRRRRSLRRTIGFPVAVKALAPELPHKAKLGGVRLGLANPTDVEVAAAEVLQAARRAGAASPRVLVQAMATGAEVLVGAVVDDAFGACITMRPGGALAEAGEAAFVAAPLTRAQALAFVRSQAERCGLVEGRHDLRAVARAVEAIARAAHDLRGRLTSIEANPLLVAERGAVAVDALAEARPPA